MKILFLSVTIGAGHNAVANNLKAIFENAGHQTHFVDLYATNKRITNMIAGYGYRAMYVFPRLARKVYNNCRKNNRSIYDTNIFAVKDVVLKEINDFAPDVIISSHIGGFVFTQKFRNEIKTPCKSFFVITDYEIPPSLHNIKGQENFIFAPTEFHKNLLLDHGFDENHVFATGIPISPKFYEKKNKETIIAARGLTGFDANKTTILFMGGAKGMGAVLEAVDALKSHDMQMLVVCGKNQRLKAKLDAEKHKNVFTFGYIDFVDELMQLSHCLFGKTGGLSATEAVAKGLQIISFQNIPSPEYDNLMFLSKHGFAFPITKTRQIAAFLAQKSQKDNSFYIPNSGELIYNTICEKFAHFVDN